MARHRRPPRAPQGRSVARSYAAAIQRVVLTALFAAIEETVTRSLPGLKQAANAEPGIGSTDRSDVVGEVSAAHALARARFAQAVGDAAIRGVIQQAAGRMAVMNRTGFVRQMSALGFNVLGEDPNLDSTLRLHAAENVRLIKRMSEEHLQRVETIVNAGLRSGSSTAEIARQIQRSARIPKRRAQLIARDQIATLNGTLQQNRMQAAGVPQFIWRTSQDERVRPDHEALEGQRFPTSTGAPGEGFPGQPINCRCTAEPVLSEDARAA